MISGDPGIPCPDKCLHTRNASKSRRQRRRRHRLVETPSKGESGYLRAKWRVRPARPAGCRSTCHIFPHPTWPSRSVPTESGSLQVLLHLQDQKQKQNYSALLQNYSALLLLQMLLILSMLLGLQVLLLSQVLLLLFIFLTGAAA